MTGMLGLFRLMEFNQTNAVYGTINFMSFTGTLFLNFYP